MRERPDEKRHACGSEINKFAFILRPEHVRTHFMCSPFASFEEEKKQKTRQRRKCCQINLCETRFCLSLYSKASERAKRRRETRQRADEQQENIR